MYSKELREKTGVSRDTLRHYVDIGLLTPIRDNHNNYLIYSKEDFKILSFVLRAKNLGFSLEEIKEIEKRISSSTCQHKSILPYLQKNLSVVQQKIIDLKLIEKHLEKIINDFKKRNCVRKPTKFEL